MNKLLEWVATAVTLAGALLTAQGNDPWNIYILNLGSFLWLGWAILEGKSSIALVNLGMLAIYLYGLIQRMSIDFTFF